MSCERTYATAPHEHEHACSFLEAGDLMPRFKPHRRPKRRAGHGVRNLVPERVPAGCPFLAPDYNTGGMIEGRRDKK